MYDFRRDEPGARLHLEAVQIAIDAIRDAGADGKVDEGTAEDEVVPAGADVVDCTEEGVDDDE